MDNPTNKNILKPLSRPEALVIVKAQAVYYPGFVRVYIPNIAFERIAPGLEARDMPIPVANGGDFNKESDAERSVRRTRRSIKDYVFCNDFDLFVTFTFASNRQDIGSCKSRMSDWLKNQRKRKGKFGYLLVPEFHKDGKALHFHGLFKGYAGEVRQCFRANGKPRIKKGRKVYELPGYTLGLQNIQLIDNKPDSRTKVGFYIQKYITKDMPIIFGKNRYWVSRNLNKPVKEDNPEQWYLSARPDRYFENDFGTILEFDAGKQPLVDFYLEANQQ